MKLFNIAFTGHRKVEGRDHGAISTGLEQLQRFGILNEITNFHIGCASGFDTMVYRFLWPAPEGMYLVTPHIPFGYQHRELLETLGVTENFWNVDQAPCLECWSGLPRPLNKADNWYYQKRNEHMVDKADVLVSYFNGGPSGTKNCIDYANKVGVPVIDIRDHKAIEQLII